MESLDRINDLPAELIDKILGILPIREAVRTSVLSNNWRYRWKSIPSILLNAKSMTKRKQADLLELVDKVLSLHSGMISTFEVRYLTQYKFADIDKWMSFLSEKNMLHEMKLVFKSSKRYQVPTSLFTCQNLRKLRLKECILKKLPPECKGFRRITSLRLCRVKLTIDTIDSLVSKIPLLNYLSIRDCSEFTRLNLDAPNLLCFRFRGIYESISFQNTPKIKYVSLHKGKAGARSTLRLDEAPHGLARTEILRLTVTYPFFMEMLPIDDALKKLKINYCELQCLELAVNLEDSKQFFIINLCGSLPYLNSLSIRIVHDRISAILFEKHLPWLRKQGDIFKRLKYVRLIDFKGAQRDLIVVRLILMNAMVLETMTVNWKRKFHKEEENIKLRVVENVMRIKKASSEAKIKFFSFK